MEMILKQKNQQNPAFSEGKCHFTSEKLENQVFFTFYRL
jgi:hypothetical protein